MMQRLLVKVVGARAERRFVGRGGLPYGGFALRVRVVGGAIEPLPIPEGIAGREAVVHRDFLLPWAPKKGDLLVLDPGESAPIVSPPAVRRGRARAFGGSVFFDARDNDRDGYREDIVGNAFATAAVQGHRGARLYSLLDRAGRDRFAHPFDYLATGKYVLLGGVEAAIEESNSPGEIWNATLEPEGPHAVAGGVEIEYRRALSAPEGVTLTRAVRVLGDIPGAVERYSIKYKGKAPRERDPRGREGSPTGARRHDEGGDSTDVTLSLKIWPAVLGSVPSMNVFHVPRARSLATVRYHPPAFARRWRWRDWRDEHFGLAPGFVVARHESLGRPTAVLFSPRRVSLVSIRSDFEGPELTVRHVTKRLRKGRCAEFGAAFLVGDACAVSASSLLLVAGPKAGQARPSLAVVVRTSKRVRTVRVSIAGAHGARSRVLTPRDLGGAGLVFAGVVGVPAYALPMSFRVTLGDETLRCELKE